MKIYNTLTRQKEEFVPVTPGKVKMYACGPTVYNYIHIGNARPIATFDVLRRYFEYKGYEVKFVQNFTDIDDKLITKANEEGITVPQVAERYIKEYWTDVTGLGVRPANVHPLATESMGMIIKVVEGLIEKGFAYEVEGDVYFRSRKFEEYGKLSHMPLEDLDHGNRVGVTEVKEDALDFALWKKSKEGEPFWESPWGKGRPGWHIECTAMIEEHLGSPIDIHCGGQDLVFPHHENEIAQAEAYKGGTYSKYWMHNGFINVDNTKMSKSLGNFFTTREVAEKFGYEPIKFMIISSHYRSPINYSYDVITQCQNSLDRLYNCRKNIDFMLQSVTGDALNDEDKAFKDKIDSYLKAFEDAMDDDFNTADGVSQLFEMTREINSYLTIPRPADAINYAKEKFDTITDVLGILYNYGKDEALDSEVEALIDEREAARAAKDFKRSDEIRDLLKEKGIELLDTPQGVKWSV